MTGQRRFLFLQGNASWFFARLGLALAKQGHAVHRINFNGGDAAFWKLPGAASYRGKLADWPAFLEQRLAEWSITDIVLFGDWRPLHRPAVDLAKARAIAVHCCDEGYLRPNWITVEQGGVNGNSSLRRDIAWFSEAARFLPAWDGGQMVRNSKLRRALDDIWYLVCTMALKLHFPHYRTHRPHHKLVEYIGGARRFLLAPVSKLRLWRDVRRIRASQAGHYLFPLQLEADSQIRFHSGFRDITSAIEVVIRSFAAQAPAGTVLAITEHPLDTSLRNWRPIVRRAASKHGIADRIYFLARGTPELLLQDARGVVTVNSTVGYLAMAFGRPVVALGEAIYDMAGLTFQGGLDAFWQAGAPADPAALDAYRRVVAAQTQVNGGYFCESGIALAVDGLLARWAQRPAPVLAEPYPEVAVPLVERPLPHAGVAPASAMAVSRPA
jgi:capsular polysaccharide export protein